MSVVVTADCRGCGACLLTCPEHAIRPRGGPGGTGGWIPPCAGSAGSSPPESAEPAVTGLLTVLPDFCTCCGECVEICPADAIEVVE